ncbi:hypothetical protein SAMN02745165_00529 [Malonomonas rubra DSM 5091]|uniref:Uncharacterized protein n=1 Tax=Malonomonas rubra DSM 5091 TaxID=1122189 RepID=A0A1M6CHN2_MALRU|nr:hypothetical protein [Malonomonas rubra]SHI60423.1 hypothetical protein SAMN02745165_00529 [Malonomonas rubra DSM 5091]
MHKLEDKREDTTAKKVKRPRPRKPSGPVGVAATFDSKGLNNFFVNYLTTMLVIEGLIFFVCFVNHLATEGSEFPWKPYLFATFITPIAITFVFGLIILTFNRYFFRDAVEPTPPGGMDYSTISWRKGDRLGAFFHIVHRLPFLFSLLLLIAATAIAYKMDAIALYAAQAGAATAEYLFISLVAILVVIALGLAIWMILSYRLRQKKLATSHEYKMQLMDQFGMVLMDDGTMLNKEGEVVYQQEEYTALGYDDDSQQDVQLIEEIKKD